MPRAKKATKRKTTRRRSGTLKVPVQVVAEPDAEPFDDEPVQPAGIFETFGDDSYTAVFWHNPESKQQEYQGRIDSNPTEQDVQDFCGGGKYTLREMARDEDTGRMMYKRQRTLTLAGRHFEPKLKRPDAAPEVGTKPVVPDSLSDAITAQIINLLNQGQNMTRQQVEGMAALFDIIRKQSEKPQQDEGMLKLLLAMMQQQTTLLQSLATTRQEPDPLAMIEKLSGIVRNTSGSPGGTVKDVIDSMESVMNIKLAMQDLASGPPESVEDKAVKMMLDYVPQFFEMAKTEKDKDAFVKKARAMLPASIQPTVQPQPKREETLQPWQEILRYYKRQLLALAQADTDPETQAIAAAQAMPPQARAVLKNWLATDTAFGDALAFLPELQPYHEWLGGYFQAMHMEFFPDLYDDDGNLIAKGGEDGRETETGG